MSPRECKIINRCYQDMKLAECVLYRPFLNLLHCRIFLFVYLLAMHLFVQNHQAYRHLTKGHQADINVVKRHLYETQLYYRHLSDRPFMRGIWLIYICPKGIWLTNIWIRHLAESHLTKRHLSGRQLTGLRLQTFYERHSAKRHLSEGHSASKHFNVAFD